MNIKDTIIRPSGEVEVIAVAVADNYFDVPTPPQPTTEETQNDIINMLVDYEYRLTLLEV